MKSKDLMNFVESLFDRGLLTKSPEEFDYEQVIWEHLKQLKPVENKKECDHYYPLVKDSSVYKLKPCEFCNKENPKHGNKTT